MIDMEDSIYDCAARRAKAGRKEHENSADNWDKWEMKRFLTEAMEELADSYNYLRELRSRLKEE